MSWFTCKLHVLDTQVLFIIDPNYWSNMEITELLSTFFFFLISYIPPVTQNSIYQPKLTRM